MKTIATFSIEYIQFLDKNSQVIAPLPAFAQDPKNLIPMYRAMNLTRTLDTKAVNLQRMGKLGTYPSSLGQEATSTGIGFAMAKNDVFAPYYRDQGVMLHRGVTIEEIFAYWGGDERANFYSSPDVQQDFPVAVPIATQFLHAAGIGYGIKFHKQNRAVVCTGGDGSTSEGDFYEAMNFAGVQNLPVVFVINNNKWAISVPLSLQTKTQTIAQKAIAAGFTGVQVDGNDIIAVRYAVSEALEKAKRGEGPTLIESISYRLCDHTTADDARRYIHADELKEAWEYEPIKRLRTYLMQQNVWSEDDEKNMLEECAQKVDQGIADYLKRTPAKATDIIDFMYAELPEELKEQREYLACLK